MTHRHYGVLPCVEVDEHVCLIEHHDHDDETVTRFTFSHDRAGGNEASDGFRCEGTVRIAGTNHPCWTMAGSLAGGDLTLSPSILCAGASGCGGYHGFVQNGKWVAA